MKQNMLSLRSMVVLLVGFTMLCAFLLVSNSSCAPRQAEVDDGVSVGKVLSVEVRSVGIGCGSSRDLTMVTTERGVYNVKRAVSYVKGEEAVLAKGYGTKKREWLCLLTSGRCYHLQ